jgi:pimeloyl-ACP methyl ester carboxylesterase
VRRRARYSVWIVPLAGVLALVEASCTAPVPSSSQSQTPSAASPTQASATPSPAAVTITAKDYKVQAVSAKDGTPLNLAVYEKYPGTNPNAVAATGKIVVVLHGATTSGKVNYDVQVSGLPLEKSFSLMDQLARRGYDVWTLDYQNYGRSDHHDCGKCVNTQAASKDVEAAVDFILKERGVTKVDLIGWSWGAETGGVVAQRSPNKVDRLVLYAPVLDLQGPPPPTDEFRDNPDNTLIGFFHPTARVPEAVAAYLKAAKEVDAKSPNGVLVDWRTDPQKMDPAKLNMPTLVIYGADDDRAPPTGPNALAFFPKLAAKDKKLVLVPNAGHGLFLEQQRERWYEEVLLFLGQPAKT